MLNGLRFTRCVMKKGFGGFTNWKRGFGRKLGSFLAWIDCRLTYSAMLGSGSIGDPSEPKDI